MQWLSMREGGSGGSGGWGGWGRGVKMHGDRKSVVEGKSVDLGGRRIIKKKTNSLIN